MNIYKLIVKDQDKQIHYSIYNDEEKAHKAYLSFDKKYTVTLDTIEFYEYVNSST